MWLGIFCTKLNYFPKENYVIRIEFQERGIPHVHSFIWIFNASNAENEVSYIKFIEKISAQLLGHLNDSVLFELVQTY